MRVDPDSKISLTVPIRTINDDICIGVKISGGQVNHLINDVEITCLASNLPEYLEIDVQEMDIGDSVLLSEITLPEGVEITILNQSEERDQAVVSVTETREIIIEEEIIEEAEEGEPIEGEEGTEEGKTEEESTEKKDQGSSKEQEQD
jgi:large subunit ribosomal protein L25